jgi:PAS domain S-box-containing protein
MTLDEIEDALRQSEERHRALFEQSPLGVFSYDRALRLTDCNDRFVQILRSTRERLVGLDLRALNDKSVLPALELALRGERAAYQGPYKATTSSAQLVISMTLSPMRDRARSVTGAVGVVEDVTERAAAEAALARSEARFRELIERAPDSVVVGRGDTILYVNPAAVRQLGYASASELAGRSVLDLIHPDDRDISRKRTAALERGESLPPQEYRLIRKDGRIAFAEVVGMQIDYDGGPALLAFARDVTERRLVHARLLQADRMVSMGMLAAGVAHEVNNPLSYVSTTLELLASRRFHEMLADVDKLGDTRMREHMHQCRELINVAREGVARLSDIVRDLRTFSRDDEQTLLLDVRRALDACVNIAWSDIRHRARLVREYADIPLVLASESRLGQVFLNLIVNAAQALPSGASQDHVITLRTFERDGRAVVEVSDTGPGIPEEIRAHLFEPFFTTKPAGVGTGLGLWISQGIVTALGGEITIRSDPGKGSTFAVVLPGAPDAPSVARAEASSAAAVGGRVLIVDDELALAQVLRTALSDEFDVSIAGSGREAIDALAHGDFDALVCDLMMPDVTGMDVYEHLRAEHPALARRVVFVSGGAFTPKARAFLESVSNARLEKPFQVDALRAVIRTQLRV